LRNPIRAFLNRTLRAAAGYSTPPADGSRPGIFQYARYIAVDLQTIRWTDPRPVRGVRYVFLTPAVAQHNVTIPFDQGDREGCKPVTFRMKPAFVTKSGKKRNHTPDPEQLKDAKLKVARDQPHIPAPEVPESRFEEGPPAPEGVEQPDIRITSGSAACIGCATPLNWQELQKSLSALIANGMPQAEAKKHLPRCSRCIQSLISSRGQANGSISCSQVSAPKRKPRVARAKISATKQDRTIPTTLGGNLPQISILSRREWGLRALRR
jgi:hypothetical protein